MASQEEKSTSPVLKRFTTVLALTALMAAGLITYVSLFGSVKVQIERCMVSSCAVSDNPERFSRDRALVISNALPGTVLREISFAEDEKLEYVFYSVKVKNENLISAETVELTPEILDGDLMYYIQSPDETVISPFHEADLTLVVMRYKDAGTDKRNIRITYYYMGDEREEVFEL